jgi:AraC family transcriptional regulator, exoenzyme S synthesis regulatory protein ExsA
MESNLNCSKIVSDSSDAQSWNDDIQIINYTCKRNIIKANMCVHMNVICIVLHGQKEILSCNGKTLLGAGSAVFMKKGSYLVSDVVLNPEVGYDSIYIFFSDEWLQSQMKDILSCNTCTSKEKYPDNSVVNISVFNEDQLLNDFISHLKSFISIKSDRERLQSLIHLKIKELFQILLSAPNGFHFEKQLRSFDTHLYPDLVQLMQNHYKENISLEQYAFLANSSLSTFKRKFQQTFKMNPGKWILQRRLEESYELLKNSEKNITEIAYEVGFETPAHFISSFKTKYRNTPKQIQLQL